jgi:hypothetical protein
MNRSSFALLLAVIGLVAFLYFPKSGESKANARIEYWEQKLGETIHINSSKYQVLEWAKENSLEFVPAEDGRMKVKVEWVSGLGSPWLICSEWDIVLSIKINPFDDVEEKSVTKVNTCS